MVKRFEIYLLNLDPEISEDPKNTRPCVVISPDEMNVSISSIIVAPVSSINQKYPTRVAFEFLGKKKGSNPGSDSNRGKGTAGKEYRTARKIHSNSCD